MNDKLISAAEERLGLARARIGSGRPRTAKQFAEQTVLGHRVIGSPGYPLDEP